MAITEEIQSMKDQLDTIKNTVPLDVVEKNRLEAEIAVKEQELAGQAEREQKKQETIDSYVDVLPDMFEALFPQEIFSQVLGLTEYAEKRQQFLQLSHTYFAEQLDGIDKQHQLDLAQKDTKIQAAAAQANDLQQKLDKAEADVNHWIEQYNDADKECTKTEEENSNLKLLVNDTQSRLNAAIEKVDDLQAKLEAAQKPRDTQPSQTLAEQINAIKSKNALSADDMIARFNSRQKNDEVKVQLPEIKPPAVEVSQFRSEDTQAEPPSDTVSAPQESEVNQFPVAPGNEVAGLPADGKVEDAAISRDEFNALKARVDKLEGVA